MRHNRKPRVTSHCRSKSGTVIIGMTQLKQRRHPDKSEKGKKGEGAGSRSISRVLSWTTIPLGVPLPVRSSSLPGSNASHAMRFPIWPCFGWGLPCRPCYHVRGELLPRPGLRPTAPAFTGAPFHPCLIRQNRLPCFTKRSRCPCFP